MGSCSECRCMSGTWGLRSLGCLNMETACDNATGAGVVSLESSLRGDTVISASNTTTPGREVVCEATTATAISCQSVPSLSSSSLMIEALMNWARGPASRRQASSWPSGPRATSTERTSAGSGTTPSPTRRVKEIFKTISAVLCFPPALPKNHVPAPFACSMAST